jgi:hypothetical protein
MYRIALITALLCAAGLAIYKKIKENAKNRKTDINDRKENIEKTMEDVYFEQIESGSRPYKLLAVYDQYDLMFIKMLFQNEQIPFYIEFENMNMLRPGVRIECFNDSFVYILDEDYEDALTVVKSYIESERSISDIKGKTKVRNIVEFAIGGYFMPKNNFGNIEIYSK